MFKVAGAVALSIFLTCTLFFVVYGLAYLGIVWSFGLIKKIKEKIKNSKNDSEDYESFLKPNKCKSFASLIKNKKIKNYIDDRKPNKQTLKNLKVTILYINHDYETRDGLSSSLVKLWEDLFNYIGVDNYEVIKQLDIQ